MRERETNFSFFPSTRLWFKSSSSCIVFLDEKNRTKKVLCVVVFHHNIYTQREKEGILFTHNDVAKRKANNPNPFHLSLSVFLSIK